jgi:hypothetical protein
MRKFTKRLVILSTVLLLHLVASAGNLKGDGSGSVYHPLITHVDGTVRVMGKEHSVWEPAEVGTLLLSGDIVKTGANASAEIMFLSGRVRLYQNSVLIIPSTGVQSRKKDIKEIFVEKGNALFDINPLGVRREFEFKTRNVQGGVKGTRFAVSYLENGTSVVVYRGKVVISDLHRSQETKRDLTAGTAIRVEGGGSFSKAWGFDPEIDIEKYNYAIPPGLDSKGMPSEHKANPKNKGVRKKGRSGSGLSSNETSIDAGVTDQGDNDQGNSDTETNKN